MWGLQSRPHRDKSPITTKWASIKGQKDISFLFLINVCHEKGVKSHPAQHHWNQEEIAAPPYHVIAWDRIKFEAAWFSVGDIDNWLGYQNSWSKLLFELRQPLQGLNIIFTLCYFILFSHWPRSVRFSDGLNAQMPGGSLNGSCVAIHIWESTKYWKNLCEIVFSWGFLLSFADRDSRKAKQRAEFRSCENSI